MLNADASGAKLKNLKVERCGAEWRQVSRHHKKKTLHVFVCSCKPPLFVGVIVGDKIFATIYVRAPRMSFMAETKDFCRNNKNVIKIMQSTRFK